MAKAKRKRSPKRSAKPPKEAKPKPKRKRAKLLTLDEMAEAHGVNRRTVKRWIKDGCPCEYRPATRGGKPVPMLDRGKVADWLQFRGKNTDGLRGGTGVAARSDEDEPVETPSAPVGPLQGDAKLLSLPGILAYRERVRARELQLSDLLQAEIAAGAAPQRIGALSGTLTAVGKELRQVETDTLDWLQKTGRLVDTEEIAHQYSRLANSTRNAVMGANVIFMSIVRPYLKKETDAPIVKKKLDECHRDGLLGLPERLARVKAAEKKAR